MTRSSEPNPVGSHDDQPGDDQRQLVLVKRGQRYLFRYAPGEEARLIAELMEMARDPDNEIDWFDAAVLSHQMGQRLGRQLENILKP